MRWISRDIETKLEAKKLLVIIYFLKIVDRHQKMVFDLQILTQPSFIAKSDNTETRLLLLFREADYIPSVHVQCQIASFLEVCNLNCTSNWHAQIYFLSRDYYQLVRFKNNGCREDHNNCETFLTILEYITFFRKLTFKITIIVIKHKFIQIFQGHWDFPR